MAMLDEEGRLFGIVNIVDALVVGLLIALVVGGVAVVDPFDEPTRETRYATVDLGEQPTYVATQIESGDAIPASGGRTLAVTDVYRTPGEGTSVAVTVRARLPGTSVPNPNGPGTAFAFRGDHLQTGDELAIDTADYSVSGSVTALDETGQTLPTQQSRVIIETTMSRAQATNVSVGDRQQLGGETVATVRSVQLTPTMDSATQTRALVGVELTALARDDTATYAGQPLTFGTSLPVATSEYRLQGEILRRGQAQIETHRIPVVVETTISPDVADAVAVNDRYRIGATTVATLRTRTVYPTAGATTQRALLGLEVLTTNVSTTAAFAGTPIQIGNRIPFRTAEYNLTGQIVRHGTTEPRGAKRTITAVVKLRRVEPSLAASLEAGLTEVRNGEEIARVVEARVEPSEVAVESDSGEIFGREHPREKDVWLTMALQVRATPTDVTFHGRELRENRKIAADFGTISINGTVVDIQS
jgi:hypothetical protein